MNFKEYIQEKKNLQSVLLEYLEDESEADQSYDNFHKVINDQQIIESQQEFKSLLYLINIIGNHHHRSHYFIKKIEKILDHFKEDIKKYLSNSEIFEFFKYNKRILLFLIEEKILVIDMYIALQIACNEFVDQKYSEYFAPEVKPFITDELIDKLGGQKEETAKEHDKYFFEKRKEGENDDFLCNLIRLDKIDEFVTYANQTNLALNCHIHGSIFETNPLLYHKEIKLIEYALFFGSIRIIKYMHLNGVELHRSMWEYAIHSQNGEAIRYLEENYSSSYPSNYDNCKSFLIESIRCHHIDITNYIIDNVIKEDDPKIKIEYYYDNSYYLYSFKYNNYCFFPENEEYKYFLLRLAEFDYYTLVSLYLQDKSINYDINEILNTKIL
ncbi:hypothetical protein M9Y10_021346 [Tritrichomonas musculus]|uniref:DUF3447 domain-containing protein n=1 Tax=Tritrichomonas musculus TaxID=1915356 RepID=A0ABR2HDS8_9EUKA